MSPSIEHVSDIYEQLSPVDQKHTHEALKLGLALNLKTTRTSLRRKYEDEEIPMWPNAHCLSILKLVERNFCVVSSVNLAHVAFTTVGKCIIRKFHDHFKSSHQLQCKLVGHFKGFLHPGLESWSYALLRVDVREFGIAAHRPHANVL